MIDSEDLYILFEIKILINPVGLSLIFSKIQIMINSEDGLCTLL